MQVDAAPSQSQTAVQRKIWAARGIWKRWLHVGMSFQPCGPTAGEWGEKHRLVEE